MKSAIQIILNRFLHFLSFSLLDNSEDERPSDPFECKHDTQAFHCHNLKEKQQGKTQARRKLLNTCAVCVLDLHDRGSQW